jgi:hypothetical protein
MPEQDARERAIDELTDIYERDGDDHAFYRLCIALYDAGWNSRSEEVEELKRQIAKLEYDIDRLLRVDMEGREEPKK